VAWEADFDDGTAQGFKIENGGGGFPGGAGWAVTAKCAVFSPPNSMYYGVQEGGGFIPECTYEMPFPFPGLPNSGVVTSPEIQLPAFPTQLSFQVMADISASAQEDTLVLEVVSGGVPKSIWSKSALPKLDVNFHLVTLSLSQFSGKKITLRWSFDATAGNGYPGKGVSLDDISITGVCQP